MSHFFSDPTAVARFARLAIGILTIVAGVLTGHADGPRTRRNSPSRDVSTSTVARRSITDRPASQRGQIRAERNDRGTYESAVIDTDGRAQPASRQASSSVVRSGSRIIEVRSRDVASQRPSESDAAIVRPASPIMQTSATMPRTQAASPLRDPDGGVRSASHAGRDAHAQPAGYVDPPIVDGYVLHPGETIVSEGDFGCGCENNIGGCDCLGDAGGCDGMSCGGFGCDSMGCNACSAPTIRFKRGERISFCRDRWFGSLEALLWFRDGDRLPSLVTTGPSTNQDTAGELGVAGTETLFGGGNTLNDLGVGGRVTIGTWLDASQCRSLVLRGWYGGGTDDGFSANSSDFAVLARPFNNFSDDVSGVADTQLINFPSIAQGSLSADLQSDVYGGDIAVRRNWKQGFLGSIDTLYGYQYMRLDEDLRISSTTISIDDQSTAFGSVLGLRDEFDISNEFHGAQLGLTGSVADGCWSLNWLAKVAFGSLRRRADLRGQTTTSLGAATAVDDQGLLVRDTNSGVTEDHTFGWVPELGVELSYRRFPNYDLTVGYSVVAMTDAIRVSSAIDDNLASNLNADGSGVAVPALTLDDGTFYIQGIHFGIAKVY